MVDGGDVYWIEGRPHEAGRSVLVRRGADGRVADVTPPGFNVRTRVHEYGGGACLVSGGTAYFSNFEDQRIYRAGSRPGSSPEPVPVTPPGAWCYADAVYDAARRRLIAVREDHGEPGREAVTALVSIPIGGDPQPGTVIASGYDFYSTPRLSPDGRRLAWLAWRHPQMPWDGTELWVADVAGEGSLEHPIHVAGGPGESIYQPGWGEDGTLYFVSDRDGRWQIYRSNDLVVSCDAEFGRAQWLFGGATWAPAGPGSLVVAYTREGRWSLAMLDLETRALSPVAPGLEPREWLAATSTHAYVVAGSAATPEAVVRVDLRTAAIDTLRASSSMQLDPAYVSVPESVWFRSEDGVATHAFYYPPRHADCAPLDGERPPLIVIGHGGPTTAASATLDLKVQFWTSRGFAVADVNYGGSTGFGRAYRQRLNGRWGLLDVADVASAARSLVDLGKADPARLIIRGGSAGGYTALAALTFRPDVFNAGASYYGVSDIEVLARDTHKFESRYLDTLIGPYPEMREVYRQRSPIHFVDRLACPLILFQGLEDTIVPPNQSEMMADAVRAKGLPVAYLTFEGEQHGFRKADTILRSLEAELYFYGVVFGFEPADRFAPIRVDNGSGKFKGRSEK